MSEAIGKTASNAAAKGRVVDQSRVAVVDGLRGLAILLVVAYHYFSRWGDPPSPYPYGDQFASFQPIASGFSGVYLFFIISGFVITRSLAKSRSIGAFAIKRMDRLVMPMIVLSVLTFALLSGPLLTPQLPTRWTNLIPSWTFTTPVFWRFVDPQIDYVDGVYWTLFTEVRFYLLISVLWFCVGSRDAIRVLALLSVSAVAYSFFAEGERLVSAVNLALFPPFISLFACGALYSRLFEGIGSKLDVLIIAVLIPISIIALSLLGPDQRYIARALPCVVYHTIFVSLILGHRWVRIFAIKPLTFLGLISYSAYLLHQNIGIALISRISPGAPMILQLLLVATIFIGMIGLAYLSWRYIETRHPFSNALRQFQRDARKTAPAS